MTRNFAETPTKKVPHKKEILWARGALPHVSPCAKTIKLGTSYTVDRNITQSDCQTICIASGGQAEFDVETKLCKCLLSKNVDDTDVALINKNAKLVGKNLDGADTTDREIIIKREIHDEDKSTTEPTTTIRFVSETTVINDKIITTAEPEKETETDLNPEAIVGQAPQRRIHHPRLGPQRRQREPRPITPEQQHLMLQQIHDHLQRLEQLSDQRLRQIEIDAVNRKDRDSGTLWRKLEEDNKDKD
ncbi:hypothetical protein GEV33_004840 [Tenebrio molitor]|uniref:Uncharacterized protein n=1 Tax=Tenebrio molitor TaxID=7067 RepID=A0A8J6HNN1_TENMO|nr:hypothetical protein GEV33_004840 [Tenebrio molitor]